MHDNNMAIPSLGNVEVHHLRRIWGGLVAFGIALIIVGFAAVGSPVVATFTTVTVFGLLLLAGAVVELVGMVWVRRWGSFFHHLLSGLLYLFLGIVLLDRPALGAAGYTLLLAIFFVGSGVARIVFALSHRMPGRGWTIVSGAMAVLLGVLIWREWPDSALWVIGTFIGIDLIFNGVTWLMIGLTLRNVPKPVESPAPDRMAHA
jgi:uncharacterized membrane protein HdeD (DUF308 family)